MIFALDFVELFSGLNVVSLEPLMAVCINLIDSLMGNSLALQGLLFLHIEIGRGTGSQLYEKNQDQPQQRGREPVKCSERG